MSLLAKATKLYSYGPWSVYSADDAESGEVEVFHADGSWFLLLRGFELPERLPVPVQDFIEAYRADSEVES